MSPPTISPVPDGTDRPTWSVMIPTFNCAEYLRQTLVGVLEQDPGPDRMQVEVVDDCSTRDDPEAVVRELGKGRVRFFRQPANGGAIKNFNSCIQRSVGRLVHILHGDDCVAPGFYERMEEAFNCTSNIGTAVCRTFIMDEKGRELAIEPAPGILSQLEQNLRVLFPHNVIRTPSIVVARSLYESIGGFREDLPHCADWEMWFRAIANGGCVAVDHPLAYYRQFAANDTSRLMKTAENLRDRMRVLQYLRLHSLDLDAETLRRSCRDEALNQAARFWAIGESEAGSTNYAFFKEISTFGEMMRFYFTRPLLRVLNNG